jgi:hypothetical protein
MCAQGVWPCCCRCGECPLLAVHVHQSPLLHACLPQVLPEAMALLERQQDSGGGPGSPYGTAASQPIDLADIMAQLWIVYAFLYTAPAGWIQHTFLFWSALSVLSILRNR